MKVIAAFKYIVFLEHLAVVHLQASIEPAVSQMMI